MLDLRMMHFVLWLIAIAIAVYLVERLAVITELLAGPIVMFTCAWLISLTIEPLFVMVQMTRMTRRWSVSLVYGLLVTIIVVLVLGGIPIISVQVDGFVQNVSAAVALIPQLLMAIQGYLLRLGWQSDMQSLVRIEALITQLGGLGPLAFQQSLGVAGGVAQLLFDVCIVLILSFYMALDGQMLFSRMVALWPAEWRDEVEAFGHIMTSTFGGFMRTQLLSSLVYAVINAVVMRLFDMPSIALVTVIVAAALMLPVIGGMIALIPPVLIMILNQPQYVIVYLVIMVVVQQILFNVVLPRIMGRAVGLHPLLVFAALLVGGSIAGPWGVLFGIPLAGVIAAVANYAYARTQVERSHKP